MVAALQSSFGAPSVKRRNAVGISMITGISNSPWMKFSLRRRTGGRSTKLRLEVGFKGVEARRDGFADRKFGGDGVGGFQAVPGDADDRGFLRLDAILPDKFLRDACGDPARGFREDAFGFGRHFDRVPDL